MEKDLKKKPFDPSLIDNDYRVSALASRLNHLLNCHPFRDIAPESIEPLLKWVAENNNGKAREIDRILIGGLRDAATEDLVDVDDKLPAGWVRAQTTNELNARKNLTRLEPF